MGDYLVRATAADSQIRAFAATTKELVEFMRAAHDCSPTVTAAVGRLMTAGVMMGSMMKNDDDLLTLHIKSDGPIEGIIVTADANGHVKGYPYNPSVDLPANAKGKLDVSGIVGKGQLRVIRDTGLKDPYVGTVDLVSGEIAEDVANYFVTSEQVPSAVALGVLTGNEEPVMQAGGLIIQMLPFASDEVLDKLEKRLSEMPSITTMLRRGMTPEEILSYTLGDMGLDITDKMPLSFTCNCSEERIEKALISTGAEELQAMIDEGKEIEVNCSFCGKHYKFSVDQLKMLYKSASSGKKRR